MACNDALTNQDIADISANVRAVSDWAEGGPAYTATMANGRQVPSPSKLIADAKLFKSPAAYNPAAQYTDATIPVIESDVVYAPIPSFLPIGPEAFDPNKWYVLQGVVENEVYDLVKKTDLFTELSRPVTASDLGNFYGTAEYNAGTGVGGAKYELVNVNPGSLGTINHAKTDGSGYWLKMVIDGVIRLSQTSAVGDGVANDFQPVQDALNSSATRIVGQFGKVYLSNQAILIPANKTFDGNNRSSTLRSTTASFVRGTSSSLACLLRNENASIVDGSIIDENIMVKDWVIQAGSDIEMDAVHVASTLGFTIQDCDVSVNAGATANTFGVDFHHSNTNGLITRCDIRHIQEGGITRGACAAFRNSNSLVASENNTISHCYLYKQGSTNTDEIMWINGATGATNNSKVLFNTFETGATDATASVLTIYRFEGVNSEVNGVLVEGNTFNVAASPSVQQVLLLGIFGDLTPARDVLLVNNILNMTNHIALKCITLQDNALFANNTIRSAGTTSTVLSTEAAFRKTDSITADNNRCYGGYAKAFIGGVVKDNWCESAETFAEGCYAVTGNTVERCTHQFVADFDNAQSMVIRGNDFVMNNATAPDAFPYAWYLNSTSCRYIVEDNVGSYNGDGFKILRSNSSGADNIFFNRNTLYKNGATDAPDMQLFTTNLGSSDGLSIFGLDFDALPIGTAYGVGGFKHALGHITRYTDASSGVNAFGKMMTTTGEKDLTVTIA